MRNRGITYDVLQILLHHCAVCRVHDVNHRKSGNKRCPEFCTKRQHHKTETDKTVTSDFLQNTGMNHGYCCRSACITIRRPAVKREHREQRTKACQKQQEHKYLKLHAHVAHLTCHDKRLNIKGALSCRICAEIKGHDSDKHEGRTHQKKDCELHSRVFLGYTLRRTPDKHHNIDRNDNNLIAEQENKQITRYKGSCYACNKHKQKNEKFLRALFNIP